MEALFVTLQIYRMAFVRGASLALRNWPVLGSVFAYTVIMAVTWRVATLLGLLGGFLIAIVSAACVGSFLYMVEMMVRTSRVTFGDFGRSFGVYLWDVLTVNFVLWILITITGLALATVPQGGIILLFLQLVILVLFNAVPELIYLGHHSAVGLLAASYRFIGDNWVEWFPPNILIVIALFALWQMPVEGAALRIVKEAAVALFLYFAMVVRGLLFVELSGSTRRGRIFRYRMRG